MKCSGDVRNWQFIAALGWLFAAIFGFVFVFQGTAEGIEGFIRAYQGVVTSLGTLGVVGILAVATTLIANRAAAKRENFAQKMQALIKISDFRQNWIDRVRDDLARIQYEFFRNPGGSREDLEALIIPLQRLRLSLNRTETNTEKLEEVLEVIRTKNTLTSLEMSAEISKLNSIGREILKDEWERLKRDLEEAHTLEETLR